MAITQTQIEKIISIAKRYGADRLILFGGAAESADDTKDIDIACDGVGGWKLYELAAQIEDELHIPLDLIPLKPSSRFTKLIERKGKIIL